MDKKKLFLCFSSFLSQFSICMINFAMIYYLRKNYGLSSGAIGIASSIYTVTYFISCLLIAPFYSRFSRSLKAFLAFFGMAASNIAILNTSSIAVIFIMLGIYGISMSFLWPNIEDWITENAEGRELARATNAFNFSWSFGAGLSTMAAGFLAEVSLSLPIALSCFFFILIMLFLILLASRNNAPESIKKEEAVAKGRPTELRYISWGGNFLNYICYSLVINIFPLYAMDSLGYGESISGSLLLFRGVATCISFSIFSRLKFWQFRKSVILASQASLALVFITLPFLRSKVLFALFFLIFGVIFALLYEMSIFHGASGSANRSRAMIIHEVLLNIGSVIGSAAGGIVYEHFSFSAISFSLASLALIFVLLESIFPLRLSKPLKKA